MSEKLDRALRAFDADAFATRHRGYKESRAARSREYLLTHNGLRRDGQPCLSERLRWRHEPGVKMAWVCWGCGMSGDTLDLIAMLERTDRGGAIDYVVDGYVGGDAPTALSQLALIAAPARAQLERLPVIAPPRGFELIDPRVAAHQEAVAYLIGERGLTYQDLAYYRIGYCRVGRFARYVIFPCFMDGGLVYYQGRATWDPPKGLSRDHRKAWEKATRYRKTLNPTNEDGSAGASDILFNYDGARVCEHLVVVEGPIDAVKVGTHATALFGKAASPNKVERLLRTAARRYTVYLDPGEEERAKAMELCAQLADFAPTFLATPPPGCDPGKLTPAQNAEIIARGVPFRAAGLVSNLRFR